MTTRRAAARSTPPAVETPAYVRLERDRIKSNRGPAPQPSPADTGEGDPRSGWEGAGIGASPSGDCALAIICGASRYEAAARKAELGKKSFRSPLECSCYVHILPCHFVNRSRGS